jgi:hypothetical protein
MARRELAAAGGGPGLEQDGGALRGRFAEVDGGEAEIWSVMLDAVDAGGIGKPAGGAVA